MHHSHFETFLHAFLYFTYLGWVHIESGELGKGAVFIKVKESLESSWNLIFVHVREKSLKTRLLTLIAFSLNYAMHVSQNSNYRKT